MSPACFIYSDDIKYKKISECAVSSFRKFHPDIPVYVCLSKLDIEGSTSIPSGIQKYIFAYEVAKKIGVDKIIILGADTITCSCLEEFLSNNSQDILATLDHPYRPQIQDGSYICKSHETHINSDVVCFNNINALKAVVDLCFSYKSDYYEQGALNFLCNFSEKFSTKIVDGNYSDSLVSYNARSKGNVCFSGSQKNFYQYTSKFHVKDGKLLTGLNRNINVEKIIRVWHYCCGIFCCNNDQTESLINCWIKNGFNQETKDFFSKDCGCGTFFNEEFKI
jgi:hypothetical protein